MAADGKRSKRFELATGKRRSPFLIADARALDFLNSVATPVDTPVEWIESGQDLLSWLSAAGLISPSVRAGFQKSAVPGELDAVAAQVQAEELDRSLARPDQAEQDPEGGRLAGPVRAEEAVDVAGLDRQVDVIDRDDLSVPLDEPSRGNRGRHDVAQGVSARAAASASAWVTDPATV